MRVFCAALCVAVFACLYAFRADASDIKIGDGLVCDTAEQAALYTSLFQEKGHQGALQAVNEDAKTPDACVSGHPVAYKIVERIAGVTVNGAKLDIVKILVVAAMTPLGMQAVQPDTFYTIMHAEGRPA